METLDRLLPPRRVAAATRALSSRLDEAVRRKAAQLDAEFARERGWVAWDRVRLIGQAQQRLVALRGRRFKTLGGGGARIVERADQPLEGLVAAWTLLRQGRSVVVQAQRGASATVMELFTEMASQIGPPLGVCKADDPLPDYAQAWPELGVREAAPRVALVQTDADSEAAAYLLARACLRRTGFDRRSVHRCIVVGERPRFERHLRRLWLGAHMGLPQDGEAFAGPVSEMQAQAYARSAQAWSELPGMKVVCAGGELLRAGTPAGWRFVAPALLRLESADAPDDPPPCVGPLLILEQVEAEDADRRFRALASRDEGALWLRFGTKPRGLELGSEDRQVQGALLLEHLPPGLPAPRP